ncbi:zeta toxin family protein [Saccharomonospora saliphila]|uniref:zeta toxin family protein n=1 Tax=Saccharomonospora saliphila TaxID=369829 RepID=UPI00036A460D|nr:zeta toxin family protein [Saccharomonospora saliphila]
MPSPPDERHEPVLIVLGGLPATGKTTIARPLAAALRAAYVRIDSIEAAAHRRRADSRDSDVPGLVKPSWERIRQREYAVWERDLLVIDTAVTAVDDAVRTIRAAAGA